MVELLDLSGVVVGVGKEVDVHVEGNCIDTAFFLAIEGNAGIETDPPNPSLYVAFALKRVEPSPKVDQRLLKKVIGFVLVFRKEVTHGEYRVFVAFDNVGESLFFFFHGKNRLPIRRKKSEKTTRGQKLLMKLIVIIAVFPLVFHCLGHKVLADFVVDVGFVGLAELIASWHMKHFPVLDKSGTRLVKTEGHIF